MILTVYPSTSSYEFLLTLYPDQYLALSDFIFLPMWYLIVVLECTFHITNLVEYFNIFAAYYSIECLFMSLLIFFWMVCLLLIFRSLYILVIYSQLNE